MIGIRKAFTLIEMTVAVAIFAVLILLTAQIFRSAMQSQKDTGVDYNLQGDSQYFLNLMSREISQAQKLTADNCGVLAGYTFTTALSGTEIDFMNHAGICIKYWRESVAGVGRIKIARSGQVDYLSGPDVDVKSLEFVVDDLGNTTSSPLVTANLKFQTLNNTTTPTSNVQLSISPWLNP